MMDVGRHPRIELLTMSDVVDVQGYVGNFKVKVKSRPRFVDPDKCTACNACNDVCPLTKPDEFNRGLNLRKIAYRPFAQAVPNIYLIDKDGIPPCQSGCPIEQHAQGYIALIRERKYEEALRVIKEDNPFPSACGRSCHHPCEGKCTRRFVDESIYIMALKRFVTDYVYERGLRREALPPREVCEHRVAIVGAGPMGMTAAQDLIKLGYCVTVFEALPVAGGMMRVGIPEHRLPKAILQRDIDDIVALGVELRLNHPIRDPLALRREGYDAVLLATGVSKETRLGIPGEELESYVDGIQFLRRVALGDRPEIGERVVVVGGGITAVDCATTAIRLGAKDVKLVYRRSRGELPVYKDEIAEAENEGMQFLERTMATRIVGDEEGRVIGLECAASRPTGTIDATGKRDVEVVPDTEFFLEADTVIKAVGQFSDLSFLSPEFASAVGNPQTFQVESLPGDGIFCHHGQIPGAGFVVNAIALGHEAASNVHHYLQGLPLPAPAKYTLPERKWSREEAEEKVARHHILSQPKVTPNVRPVAERTGSFNEVWLTYTEEQALREANRCLDCASCCECKLCVWACGPGAINHRMAAEEHEIEVGALVLATGYDMYDAGRVSQYGHGRYPNVVDGFEFERMTNASGPTGGKIVCADGREPKSIAILHCIGSRDDNHKEYCSRLCCMYALKLAHLAKDLTAAEVYEFYIDIRAPGKGYEEFYRRVQEDGVHFIRGKATEIEPSNGRLLVRAEDTLIGEQIDVPVDMAVLITPMVPAEGSRDLGHLVGVSVDKDGFFNELHPKLAPVSTAAEGVFLAGCAQGVKDIPDTVAQASAAASKVIGLLAKREIEMDPVKAYVTEERCSGCGECVLTCPYSAISLVDGHASVNLALCKGCGTCVGTCVSHAIDVTHFEDQQLMAELVGIMQRPGEFVLV
jgi:heterodisulfide reductase subunit A2